MGGGGEAQTWEKNIEQDDLASQKKSSMTMDAEKKYLAWKHRVGERSKILFCHSAIFSKINFEISLTYKCIKI